MVHIDYPFSWSSSLCIVQVKHSISWLLTKDQPPLHFSSFLPSSFLPSLPSLLFLLFPTPSLLITPLFLLLFLLFYLTPLLLLSLPSSLSAFHLSSFLSFSHAHLMHRYTKLKVLFPSSSFTHEWKTSYWLGEAYLKGRHQIHLTPLNVTFKSHRALN